MFGPYDLNIVLTVDIHGPMKVLHLSIGKTGGGHAPDDVTLTVAKDIVGEYIEIPQDQFPPQMRNQRQFVRVLK